MGYRGPLMLNLRFLRYENDINRLAPFDRRARSAAMTYSRAIWPCQRL